MAAVQVLTFLDGAGSPATLGSTVELDPPDLLPRLRRWPPHPGCGCLDTAGPAGSRTRPEDPLAAPVGVQRRRQGEWTR
jgi:hypothetical protein